MQSKFKKFLFDPKTQDVLFFGFFAGLAIFQIWQSFATSGDIRLVFARGEDDGNFHEVIRILAEDLRSGNWKNFFQSNAGSYGWLFWCVSTLISLPGYFLSSAGLTDTPLIVGMSLSSLIVSFLGIFLIYKLLLRLTNDQGLSRVLVVTFALSRAFSVLSIKWHPASWNFMLNCLACYLMLVLSPEKRKTWIWVSLVCAASFAFRMVGLIMMPIALGVLTVRAWDHLPLKKWAGNILIFCAVFSVAGLVLSFPYLVFLWI